MAITAQDVMKLRKMTSAGMMDCKNALTEAEGDFDKAMEIIRKKGQAVAAKRSDREASEGCVLAKKDGEFAAIIALKCETDFVAKNADFNLFDSSALSLAIRRSCSNCLRSVIDIVDPINAFGLPEASYSAITCISSHSWRSSPGINRSRQYSFRTFFIFPLHKSSKAFSTQALKDGCILLKYSFNETSWVCTSAVSILSPGCTFDS